MMRQKKYHWMFGINALLITAVFILNYLYQSSSFDVKLKYTCSAVFALLGLINLGYALAIKQRTTAYPIWIALGLVLAALADWMIIQNFLIGAAVFAIAHVCFIVAYCTLQRITGSDLLVSVILFLGATAFLLLCPLLKFSIPMLKYLCIAYALIISCMTGKAIGNWIRQKTGAATVAMAGSLLFFVSDLMLVLDGFIGWWEWTNEACMGTYYPAVCFLALSIYLQARSE